MALFARVDDLAVLNGAIETYPVAVAESLAHERFESCLVLAHVLPGPFGAQTKVEEIFGCEE